MLTLNLNLLYTVVNILVLFLLLRKFLYKPVMNIIAQRQKQVDDALNAAETSKQEAAAALNDAQAKLPPRPSASTSCVRLTPRPLHWPAPCARSCWPAA